MKLGTWLSKTLLEMGKNEDPVENMNESTVKEECTWRKGGGELNGVKGKKKICWANINRFCESFR